MLRIMGKGIFLQFYAANLCLYKPVICYMYQKFGPYYELNVSRYACVIIMIINLSC